MTQWISGSRWPRDLSFNSGIVAGYIGFKSNYEKKLWQLAKSAEMFIRCEEKMLTV